MTTDTERIDEILAALPVDERDALASLRASIAAAVPDAIEGFSYGVPAFRYHARPLAAYAAAKGHLSYFPMSPAVLDRYREELGGFDLAKGTVRFTPDHRIPEDLVTRIVRSRAAEIDGA